MNYDLVIFDLGGVVVQVESERLLQELASLLARPVEQIREVVYHKDLLLPFELGRIGSRDYYQGLKTKLGLSWTYERFVQGWNGIFEENRDVTWIMQRLRKRHKLIALSNTNELHLHYIRTTISSLSVLDDWVASCEVGFCKPDPQIYELALRRGGTRARAAIYIDDRPELVQAGASLGLKAIRFEESRQLEQELQALGLNF